MATQANLAERQKESSIMRFVVAALIVVAIVSVAIAILHSREKKRHYPSQSGYSYNDESAYPRFRSAASNAQGR